MAAMQRVRSIGLDLRTDFLGHIPVIAPHRRRRCQCLVRVGLLTYANAVDCSLARPVGRMSAAHTSELSARPAFDLQ